MSLFVRCQVRRLSKSFKAVGVVTDVGFLPSVSSKMCAQVEIKTKSFVTKCTLEWFLASVDELMTFELWVVEETFVAAINRTNILTFTMCHQVLSQTWRVLKQFCTSQHVTLKNSTLFTTYIKHKAIFFSLPSIIAPSISKSMSYPPSFLASFKDYLLNFYLSLSFLVDSRCSFCAFFFSFLRSFLSSNYYRLSFCLLSASRLYFALFKFSDLNCYF